MLTTYNSLPAYLKQYCVDQDYDAYTSRDHAAWRFIMRQNQNFFRTHAVPIYEQGLKKTGIPIDRIPRISEMNEKLRQFGWGAVAVNGFIPPAAFLEFQALGILAIACDMRTLEHVEYTPAPDIVHEAAGHAPIIADPAYAAYLRKYAQMAKKAIFSKEDINVYEAIRYLSDIKENPDTEKSEIERAEARFQAAVQQITHVSEATKVGRMAWWTVEYGLVGPIKRPLIYGAGLLSSVGESQNCLSQAVKKIPLTVDCVEQGFDITKPQPQLYVAQDMNQLTTVLEDLEKNMAFQLGGKVGLDRALQSQTVNSVILDSGLAISGELQEYSLNSDSHLDFIKLTGPSQLSIHSQQLLGHGRNRHPQGFSSPLGRWKKFSEKKATLLSDSELNSIGIQRGRNAKLEFKSGFTIDGVVAGWHREQDKLVYITWRNCTVQRQGTIYYQPSWGDFDQAIGESAVSVHGGPASREDFGEYDVGKASTKPGRSSPYTSHELAIFDLYQKIRNLRKNNSSLDAAFEKELEAIAYEVIQNYPTEWLVGLELLELVRSKSSEQKQYKWLQDLSSTVINPDSFTQPVLKKLLQQGIDIAAFS